MFVRIRVSGKKEAVPSTLKVGRFYDAQVYRVFPIQPTRFNLEGNREYGIIYSLYDPQDGSYAAHAESFQIVTGPTSTLLNLLIAVTHKQYTSKFLENKTIDLDLLVGKHLSLSFKLSDKSFMRVDARMARKSDKCIEHDLTVVKDYILPSWIRPEIVEGADTAELEEVDETVDLNAVLSGLPTKPVSGEALISVEEAPVIAPTLNTETKGTLSDIVGFDCSPEVAVKEVVVEAPSEDVGIDLSDFTFDK